MRFAAQVAEIGVVALQNGDVALKFFDVLVLNAEERGVLKGVPYTILVLNLLLTRKDAFFFVCVVTWWDVLELGQVNHNLRH